MNRKIAIIVGLVIVMIIALVALFQTKDYSTIDDFQSCASKYPVRESYPEVCATPDGRTFTNPDQQISY